MLIIWNLSIYNSLVGSIMYYVSIKPTQYCFMCQLMNWGLNLGNFEKGTQLYIQI